MGTEKVWRKQWGSKRWHVMRMSHGAATTLSACGKQIAGTKEAPEPPWHVACVGCLRSIQKKRLKVRRKSV